MKGKIYTPAFHNAHDPDFIQKISHLETTRDVVCARDMPGLSPGISLHFGSENYAHLKFIFLSTQKVEGADLWQSECVPMHLNKKNTAQLIDMLQLLQKSF